jgi:chemotaxis protein MotB
MKRLLVVFVACSFLLSSCLVSKKKFDAQKALAEKHLAERNSCQEDLEKANTTIELLREQIKGLENDTLNLSREIRKCTAQKNDAEKMYADIKKRYDELLTKATDEKTRLSEILKDKERELNAKAKELDELSTALAQKQQRINDLETLIAKKDEAVNNLKKKIADALIGFNSDELTVTQKDGKVYVSMSDKLLFKTGSYTVDVRGKQALSKLADVLNKNTEIGIMVEGHTDNKPYRSPDGNIKNNWDLSVMRASSVAEILVSENKVDPKRVTAAGHGEFFPVASNDTPEGRSKNRRTEIVLSPDLREIFKILESVK